MNEKPFAVSRAPTIRQLERAHAFFAWAVVNDGAVYLPLLRRMEHELHQARQTVEGMAYAQRILDGYAGDALLDGFVR